MSRQFSCEEKYNDTAKKDYLTKTKVNRLYLLTNLCVYANYISHSLSYLGFLQNQSEVVVVVVIVVVVVVVVVVVKCIIH